MNKLWKFTDNLGSFESDSAHKVKSLYFPLCNENLMSSITPDLHGDIKASQKSFLLTPVSRIDLIDSRSSRNFWVYINKDKIWSATGVSKDLKQIKEDKFKLEAGLLWHKVIRENKKIGLKSEILSFVPASGEPVEIMQITLTNVSQKKIKFVPTAAIPIYGRSADNLRDHRHVTSLLQRVTLNKFGVIVKPTLSFDESGHKPNRNNYFVLGWEQNAKAPLHVYPTQEGFCGDDGDLEAPSAVLNHALPNNRQIQGKEAMGGLRFAAISLAPKQSHTYIIVMGITQDNKQISNIIDKFNSLDKVKAALENTKKYWIKKSNIGICTGNSDFDNWFRWVSIQPTLRRIFGCSFLPDFDYGKGGRGWRDLWQDCLSLILSEAKQVRSLLLNNFSGVRIDGSNATIIGKKPGEFIADRNNIKRAWMDHGVWPILTLDLYLNKTGDFDILFKEATYFHDSLGKVRSSSGKVYRGTILEHLLLENLAQFFNVGAHNHIRLLGADWNDGLDMASKSGESVAFSCMYAHNLGLLSSLLMKAGRRQIKVAKEISRLLPKINYNNIKAKQQLLNSYFNLIKNKLSGKKISLDAEELSRNLREKSDWMMQHIRKNEWLKAGFFNGYYDNKKRRVEGVKNGNVRMILASQVFAIMSGVATDAQIEKILKSINRHLLDPKLKGYHLNTDFEEEQHDLGRAFSFVYGDKENGAFFNHMSIMLAFALYKRGYKEDGRRALKSIYGMATNSKISLIYPCLPEYFNLEGKGMYSYLTGSASWFIYALEGC